METKRVYKQSIKYRKRKISDRIILMGMKNTYEINEVGDFILEHLDGNLTLDCIIDLLVKEYDSCKDTIEKDAVTFMNFLLEKEIVEVI